MRLRKSSIEKKYVAAARSSEHRCPIELRECVQGRPVVVESRHHAGSTGPRDLLAERLTVCGDGSEVILAEIDGDGLADLKDRFASIGALSRQASPPTRVLEERVKSGEGGDGTLAAPEVNQRIRAISGELVVRLTTPSEWPGVPVDAVDVEPFCLRERGKVRHRPKQIWP